MTLDKLLALLEKLSINMTQKEIIMKEKKRKELLQNTFRMHGGEKCTVGGYKNSVYATVAPDSGGFYTISWEKLKGAKESNKPIYPETMVGSWWLKGQ